MDTLFDASPVLPAAIIQACQAPGPAGFWLVAHVACARSGLVWAMALSPADLALAPGAALALAQAFHQETRGGVLCDPDPESGVSAGLSRFDFDSSPRGCREIALAASELLWRVAEADPEAIARQARERAMPCLPQDASMQGPFPIGLWGMALMGGSIFALACERQSALNERRRLAEAAFPAGSSADPHRL